MFDLIVYFFVGGLFLFMLVLLMLAVVRFVMDLSKISGNIHNDGLTNVVVRLDGYAIIPMEEYRELTGTTLETTCSTPVE